jgi:surfactin family lipopeptide synthetase A
MMNCSEFICRIQEAASKASDRLFIVDQDGQREVTYAMFYNQVLRLVAMIKAQGLAPQSFVPIVLPDEMEYFAAELAIWMTGHAAVHCGTTFPKQRIDYIVAETEATCVIDETFVAKAQDFAPTFEIVERSPDTPCAMFYTSGSLGNPKGVLHTDESFWSAIEHYTGDFGFDGLKNGCTTTSCYFVAVAISYAMLKAGCVFHILSADIKKDINAFEDYLASQNIEFTFISPSLLRIFHSKSTCLKVVMTGSERLVGCYTQDYKLINSYGQSETLGPYFFRVIDKNYDNAPIGKPPSSVDVRVLDAEGHEVEDGEVGELCICGGMKMPIYFKNEERTAEMMRGGVYHSGDYVKRIPATGDYLFVNRIDWMVKINGMRVEPGEVEFVMKKVSGVMDAVVKGFSTHDLSRQYLVGYYISDEQLEESYLCEELGKSIPPYMIPQYFVRMEKFPLNANNKIDRKSFLPPSENVLQEFYVAPTNETEKLLCEAFAKVLALQQVGINDDFIRLGGDSIRLMQLQKECRALFLSTKDLYRLRTPKRIADYCSKRTSDSKHERKTEHPLSQTQLGVYLECQKHEGEAVYNNPFLFKLPQSIDLHRLCTAITTAVNAHVSLNTRLFINNEGDVCQKQTSESYVQTITSLSDESFKQHRQKLVRPFLLLKDRLFRIEVIQTESANYLFADFHHVIFDGTSHGIFFADVDAAYRGKKVEGENYTHFDVADEEEYQRNSESYNVAKKWYAEEFGGLDVESVPMGDRNLPQKSFAKEKVPLHLSLAEIENRYKSLGCSLNVLSVATLGYQLGVYGRKNESLFATFYHGRSDLRTEKTMGMFVKTLPIHCVWEKDTTVKSYLLSVKSKLLGAMNNDIYSFAEASADLGVSSDILFGCQTSVRRDVTLNGSSCQPEYVKHNATGETMLVELFAEPDGLLQLEIEYDESRFSPEFVQHFISCYKNIMEGMLSEDVLSDIRLVSEEERQELIALGTAKKLPTPHKAFPTLFVEQAARTPDRIAVVDKDSEMTYRELDRQSNIMAQQLIDKGVCPGDFVGVMLERRKEFVVAVIAIHKTGAAYVPLDLEYPEDRLQYMVENSETKVIVTEHGVRTIETAVPKLYIEDVDYSSDVAPIDYSDYDTGLAYMIYTSGSTGKPKGVMMHHIGLINVMYSFIDIENLTEDDRLFVYASFSFDVHTADIFPILILGGTTCIIPSEIRKDPNEVYNFLVEKRITGGCFPTAMGCLMLNNYENLPLRYVMMAGEKLEGVMSTDHLRVMNGYGPSECTFCNMFELPKGIRYKNIPIGPPVINNYGFIIDAEGRLVPKGVAGEFCFAGCQVGRGYWKLPERTAQSFVDCPFIPGERMYHTGDLCRWTASEDLECLGRIDKQVKLRGFRIELGEIETTASMLPEISRAVADVREVMGSKQLVLYYKTHDGAVKDKQEFEQRLQQHMDSSAMPVYMHPDLFMQIDVVPLSPNGKVNRTALPMPEVKTVQAEYVAPRNETEKMLCEAFSRLLHIEQVGIDDDFFSMGGNSLKMMGIQKECPSLIISTKMLFEGRTPRQIAILLSNSQVVNKKRQHQEDYALSGVQRVAYTICSANEGKAVFNVPYLFKLDEKIDMKRLAEAIEKMVCLHPAFGTHLFVNDQGEVRQKFVDYQYKQEVETVSDKDFDLLKSQLIQPFLLLKDRLFRIRLIQTETAKYLFYDMHHIIYDGGSMKVLVHDIDALYKGEDVSPEDWNAFELCDENNQLCKGKSFENAKNWYAKEFVGAPSSLYPKPDRNGAEPQMQLVSRQLNVSPEKLKAICEKEMITMNVLVSAAGGCLIGRYCGVNEAMLQSMYSAREDKRSENVIGCFATPVLMHMKWAENESVSAYLQRVGKHVLEGIKHCVVYSLLDIGRDLHVQPAMPFIFQGTLQNEDFFIGDTLAKYQPISGNEHGSPINVHVFVDNDGHIVMRIFFLSNLYSPEYIEQFMNDFNNILEQIATGKVMNEIQKLKD